MKNKFLKLIFFAFGICALVFFAHVRASAATVLKIAVQPKAVTVENNETATVRVIAEGEGLTYKWYYKNPGSSKYTLTKSFTDNTYSISMSNARDGRYVYCIITDNSGNRVKTKTVPLNMRKPLKIVTQPKTVTVKKGATAKTKVVVQGTGLKYEWYFKNADASSYSLAKGFTGNSYSITMTDARAGRYVYCVITDDLGNSKMTDVVTLNMQSLKIVTQPQSVSVEEGEKATVKVVAKGTNLKYKWYYRDAGESKCSLAKEFTGSTYSMSMSKEKSGRFVYCVVSDDYGNSVKSDSAYLLMDPMLGPVITKQPQNPICSIGETVKMSVKVDGIAPHFMWQYSTDGVKWTDLNKTASTYSLKATSPAFKRMYRCYVWDDYGYACATEAVRLLDKSVLILSQPKNWVGCESGTAYFEVDVLDSVVSCQWQFSTNDGETWKNCGENDTFYSTTATAKRSEYLYRCVVKDAQGRTQISDTVALAITDRFCIAVQPQSVSARFGQEVVFRIQAGGTDVKFEWQRSEDGKKWSAFGTKKARANQILQRYNVGKFYRCVVTNGDGKTLVSNVVQLKWTNTGFFIDEGKKYYIKENGCLAIGLQKIDSKTYYFADSGIMLTGMQKKNGKIYYFTVNGAAATGFTYVPEISNTLYFDKNGVAATGWTKISGKTYYFYESGAKAWGVTQIGKGEYYFDPTTGAQTFGMVQVGLNDYMYFQEGKDEPYTGLKKVNGELYYFAKGGSNRGITQGSMQTVNNKTYYFNPITKKATTGLLKYGKNTYFMGEDCVMVKSKFIKIDGNTYYFDSDGAMSYGLHEIKNKRYYFDPATGAAVGGWVDLDGTWLYFDPGTYTAKTGLVTINGSKYLFNTNGYLKTGVLKYNGTYYYFSEPDETKTGFIEVNQKAYYIHKNQKVAKGLTKVNKKLYYFDAVGVMQTGMRNIKGERYYFDAKTGAAITGLMQMGNGNTYYFKGASGTGSGLTKIKGKLYYLNSSGIVRYGRIKDGKKIYYFDPATGEALTGWQTIVSSNTVRKAYFDPKTYCAVTGLKKIDGKLYYFDSNGWAQSGNRKVKGVTYFFSPGTNEAYTGWFKNKDGTQGYFDGAKGKLIGPGTFKIKGKTYYIDSRGRRKTGEITVGGKKLYFDPVTAALTSKKTTKTSNKTSAPAQHKLAGTWGKLKGVKCFYGMNGKPLTGLQTIDGKLYYFDKNGKMKTGLQKVNGAYYYFGQSGAISGIKKIKGKEYYFSPSNCQMLSGIYKVDNIYRYYNEKGIRRSGWVTTDGGERLYISAKGLQTGLVKIGGKTYYFGENGVMRTGLQRVTASNGKQRICLFDKKGVMVTGLVKDGKNYYYYDPKTGDRITGFVTVKGKEYYFDPATGKAKTGLQNIDGVYCFFDLKTAQRKYGLQKAGKKLYCFTKNAAKAGLEKGITVVNKKTYYFSDGSGIALSGYREIDGVMYYFDPSTFTSVSGIRRGSNGAAYLFKANGGIRTGWQKIGNKTYYFYPTTGEMAEGLASVKDKLYYFDFNKGRLCNTKVTVGGVTYKFDKNGYGVALGESNLSKVINAGIACFDKGYGRDGDSEDPENVTCSQLMTAVYKTVGIALPERSARQYYPLLKENDVEIIESMGQAKPGDIIFFSTVNCSYGSKCDFWNEIHHVGMYVGEGKIMGSYEIKGDTENNGPMIKNLPAASPSAIVYTIVRINVVNK